MSFFLGIFASLAPWHKDHEDGHKTPRLPGAITTSSDAEQGKGGRTDSRSSEGGDDGHRGDGDRKSIATEEDNKRTVVFKRILLDRGQFRAFAKYSPLIAAILAPFATLMDVPALTERWYYYQGSSVPDPPASLILSALGLAFNVIANALLIIRFSSKTTLWVRISVPLSLAGWLLKTALAAINLIVFGATRRNGTGYTYSEAFWCAIVSFIVAVVITFCLLVHFWVIYRDRRNPNKDAEAKAVRAEGKKFMLSVTAFLFILGIQSLVFSRIEQWQYSNAIYFSVQTALTIGYGDLAPTTAAGKVLIFPFAVLTISQLGNEVALIIAFISDRANERRDKWKRRYEGAIHREANSLRPKAGLLQEMALIHQINNREEMMNQLYDLFWSAVSLLVFWLAGAAIFHGVQGWSYGNAVYAVMILSLTIGFGDYTPTTPAARVVFICYALMAVPIVTSFAVQTITGLLSTVSQRTDSKDRFRKARTLTPDAFNSHSDFVLQAHETYDHMKKRLFEDIRAPEGMDRHMSGVKGAPTEKGQPESEQLLAPRQSNADKQEESDDATVEANEDDAEEKERYNTVEKHLRRDYRKARKIIQRGRASRRKRAEEGDGMPKSRDMRRSDGAGETDAAQTQADHDADDQAVDELELELTSELMHLVIQLEAEARQIMLDSMNKSIARTLLLADRNVQIRDVRALQDEEQDILAAWRGEVNEKQRDDAANDRDHDHTLERVRRYRNTFAEVLVLGSILQKLEGEEAARFERWREDSHVDDRQTREEAHEDLGQLADSTFGGLTGRVFKIHAKKLRSMDWEKMVAKWDTEPAQIEDRKGGKRKGGKKEEE